MDIIHSTVAVLPSPTKFLPFSPETTPCKEKRSDWELTEKESQYNFLFEQVLQKKIKEKNWLLYLTVQYNFSINAQYVLRI